MKSKKAVENTLLAVVGIGLITAAVVLLSKRKTEYADRSRDDRKVMTFEDYDNQPSDVRVFSETGILL